jgi:hypothetical protein
MNFTIMVTITAKDIDVKNIIARNFGLKKYPTGC